MDNSLNPPLRQKPRMRLADLRPQTAAHQGRHPHAQAKNQSRQGEHDLILLTFDSEKSSPREGESICWGADEKRFDVAASLRCGRDCDPPIQTERPAWS